MSQYDLPGEEDDLALVKLIAEKWGYGRLMQFLSQEWYKKDPIGALTIGPAYQHYEKVNSMLDNLIGDYKSNEEELTAEDLDVLNMIFKERHEEEHSVLDPDGEIDDT
jgi:hypothetical protein